MLLATLKATYTKKLLMRFGYLKTKVALRRKNLGTKRQNQYSRLRFTCLLSLRWACWVSR